MSKLHRIIENPLDYLRPPWRSSLLYFALLAILGAAAAAIIQNTAPHQPPPAPAQPAGR